eukprot:TRINITY_DN8286_c1_g1_i2.p1 TRINITY_DN8286_c1_g1~~TRINITY_DN8286_c1_g1_i2.p1  ORF type:complete len:238 (+),score=47.49 TRINITY_DN8286_c1_g1_i2:77-790(+)
MDASDSFVEQQLTLDLSQAGLGFSIVGGTDEPLEDGTTAIVVSSVLARGAAFGAGVKLQDQIIAVDNTSFVNVTHSFAVDTIKAAIPNRVIKLRVKRSAKLDSVDTDKLGGFADRCSFVIAPDRLPAIIAEELTGTRTQDAKKAFAHRDPELSRLAHDLATAPENHMTGSGQYIKAAVFGGLDGIITTFAVVASVTGANLATGVVIIMVSKNKHHSFLSGCHTALCSIYSSCKCLCR